MKERCEVKAHPDRQIEIWEQHIHSFVAFCGPQDTAKSAKNDSPLSGLRVGVKDVIDVAGMKTSNGSLACQDALPAAQDAEVVAALRANGAEIIGKTTTTEFAFTDPTSCRNPYDVQRSPGGSSSGSGAAVAAGLIDVALGTQTAGSLCRPAAYCGAVGFKPSYAVLPRTGATPLAPSFDTIGIIATSVELASKCFQVMCPTRPEISKDPVEGFRAVKTILPADPPPAEKMVKAYDNAAEALGVLNIDAKTWAFSADVSDVVHHHRRVMNYEAVMAHEDLLQAKTIDLLQPKFRTGLLSGRETSAKDYNASVTYLSQAKCDFWQSLDGVDTILTLVVPDGAPLIDGTTGFQDWLTPWTVFGGPLISLPWGLDQLGRPLSIMLAGHPGQDMKLLALAKALEDLAPPMPHPTLPKL